MKFGLPTLDATSRTCQLHGTSLPRESDFCIGAFVIMVGEVNNGTPPSAQTREPQGSLMNTSPSKKTGLDAMLTPGNCALMLIDHQPFQAAAVKNIDVALMINKELVPVV
jgi:hypothetical protein